MTQNTWGDITGSRNAAAAAMRAQLTSLTSYRDFTSQSVSTANTVNWQDQGDVFAQPLAAMPATGVLNYVSNNAGDTENVTAYGFDGAGLPVSETIALTGLVAVVGAQAFAIVTLAVKASPSLGTVTISNNPVTTTLFSMVPCSLGAWTSVAVGPATGAYLGLRTMAFVQNVSPTPSPSMVPQAPNNSLGSMIGTGAAFDLRAIIKPGNVTRGGGDPYDDECIVQDTSNTYFTWGLSFSGGNIYVRAALHDATTQRTTPQQASVIVQQGKWYAIRCWFDGTNLQVTVDAGAGPGAVAVAPNSVGAIPAVNGTLRMAQNWRTGTPNVNFSNFTIAWLATCSVVQSAPVDAALTSYLDALYLTRVDYTPALGDLWGNGDTVQTVGDPVGPSMLYSSDSMLVGTTTSQSLLITIAQQYGGFGVSVRTAVEAQILIGVGTAGGGVVWDWITVAIPGHLTNVSGYQIDTLVSVPIPGADGITPLQLWIINPTRLSEGTGAYTAVQSLSLDHNSTWTPVLQPATGALFASDAVDDAALGDFFGWKVIAGVLQGGLFAADRTAALARLAQATSGQAAGTILIYSPQTNDLRGGTTASDGQLQAQHCVADFKAALPGWKIVYVTLLPIATVLVPLVTQTAFRAAESAGAVAGGADLVIDGSTVYGLADVSPDNVHPYLSGIKKALAVLVPAIQGLGRGGKMIYNAVPGIMGAFPARYSPQTPSQYVGTTGTSLGAMLRRLGW